MMLHRTNDHEGANPRRRCAAASTCRAAGLLVVLLATACTQGPGSGGSQQKTGWLDNNVGVSRTLTPGSTSASEVFQLADGALNCILTILPVVNDNSTFYQPESGQLMGTVSGSLACNGLGEIPFYDSSVPKKNRFDAFGVVLDLNSITHRYGESGPSVDVTLYADCPSTGCPGATTRAPGSSQPPVFSGVSSGLGAKWIVSPPAGPGAAPFQVAFPGQGTRECWVYVWSVADSRQANSDSSYPTEAPVSGEVWCAPYAPVVFNASVPSNTFAEVRPRDSNSDGPPVLLTLWSTRALPPQANVAIAADCPTGTCPPPPAAGATPPPVTPGAQSSGSLSGTDTVFDPAKHWYLCQDGIDSEGQVTFCDRATRNCVRDASIGGSALLCLTTQQLATQLVNTAPNGNTFRECDLGDGRFGWQYRSPQGEWYGCQAPGNKPGECGWVFGQLETLWSEWGLSLAKLPPFAQQQRAACTAERGQAPGPTAPAPSAGGTTPSYAAGDTAGNTAPPVEQSLCAETCGAGKHCVVSLDFSAFTRGDSRVASKPTIRLAGRSPSSARSQRQRLSPPVRMPSATANASPRDWLLGVASSGCCFHQMGTNRASPPALA